MGLGRDNGGEFAVLAKFAKRSAGRGAPPSNRPRLPPGDILTLKKQQH